jgi:hypothetical protein
MSNPSMLLAIAGSVIAPYLAPELMAATGSTLLGGALTGATIGGGEGLISSGGCFCAALKGAAMGGLGSVVTGGLANGFGCAAGAGAASSPNLLQGVCLGGYGGPAASYSLGALCPTNVALGAAPSSMGCVTSSLGSAFYCQLQQPSCNLGFWCQYGGDIAKGAKMAAKFMGRSGAPTGAVPQQRPGMALLAQPSAANPWLCGSPHELSTGNPTVGMGLAPVGSLYNTMTPLEQVGATYRGCQPLCGPCKPITGMHGAPTLMGHAEGGPITGLGALAEGGLPARHHPCAPDGHEPEFITGETGYYARGRGTGQSDDIPAMLHEGDYVIDADAVAALGDGSNKAGAQRLDELRGRLPHKAEGGRALPAKIADGEYVFPAGFVTALGDGDNRRGAEMLDGMREALRAHKRSAPEDKIPPRAKSPLEYLEQSRGEK